MKTSGRVDVKAFIDQRGMTSRRWLLLVLCFLVVAVSGMDAAIISLLAIPAILAGLAVRMARVEDVDQPATGSILARG